VLKQAAQAILAPTGCRLLRVKTVRIRKETVYLTTLLLCYNYVSKHGTRQNHYRILNYWGRRCLSLFQFTSLEFALEMLKKKKTLRNSFGKMNAQISYKSYLSLNLPAVVSPAKSKEEYLELNKYICPDY
jgi:hypothetical protein